MFCNSHYLVYILAQCKINSKFLRYRQFFIYIIVTEVFWNYFQKANWANLSNSFISSTWQSFEVMFTNMTIIRSSNWWTVHVNFSMYTFRTLGQIFEVPVFWQIMQNRQGCQKDFLEYFKWILLILYTAPDKSNKFWVILGNNDGYKLSEIHGNDTRPRS